MRMEIREKEMIIVLTGGSPINNCEYYFACNTEGLRQDHKHLLVRNLSENFRASIQSIRQEEYNNGWKDAKGKKRKNTWFRGAM